MNEPMPSSPGESGAPVPRRTSLISQSVEYLRQQILSGGLKGILPGESELTERMLVGRNTVRKALAQLTREGWIEPGHPGRKRRILFKPKDHGDRLRTSRVIELLSPYSLERMPALTMQLMDDLRNSLQTAGYTLRSRTSRAFQQEKPGRTLQRHVAESDAAAWILVQTPRPVQRWFYRTNQPAVILGMAHDEVRLPAVSQDQRAVGRHAAGLFLARGHRRLVLLRRKSRLAGSRLLLEGLQEGCASSGSGDTQLISMETEPDVQETLRTLDRVAKLSPRPTGMIVEHCGTVPTVLTGLAQRGLLCPRDYALLSIFDGPELSMLVPDISRYETNHKREVRRVVQLAIRAASQGPFEEDPILLMPEYRPGASLETTPARETS